MPIKQTNGGKVVKIKDKFNEFAGTFKPEEELEEELEAEGLDPLDVEKTHFDDE